jgi:hypothetical protein
MTDDPLLNWDLRTAPVAERDLKDRLHEVGAGAMGRIFVVHGAQPSCFYKMYKEPGQHADRLDHLIDWRRRLNGDVLDFLDEHCAWPIVTVVDKAARTLGFLMKPAPTQFWFTPKIMTDSAHSTANANNRQTLKLSHLILPDKAQAVGVQAPDSGQRLDLLEDLAKIFNLFSQNGIVYGDVSENNVMWTVTPRPQIFLIDCDNARPDKLPGEYAGVAMSSTHGIWHDPAIPKTGFPGGESDRFALAMFCYRVFYQAWYDLSFEGATRELPLPRGTPVVPLQRVLELGLSENPRERPPAADWLKAVEATRRVLQLRASAPASPSSTGLTLPASFIPDWLRPRVTLVWMVVGVVLLGILLFLIL